MLVLPREFVDEMVRHAQEEFPNESCGIIAGKDGQAVQLYRMTNVEASPYRYYMDPKQLYQVYREIEDRGWELLAIYHSHTHSPAYPSATDVRLASWPDAYYILVSLQDRERPQVRAFRIVDGEVREEELVVEGGPRSGPG